MKKLLIIGADGFLGTKLCTVLKNKFELIKSTKGSSDLPLDITNQEQVSSSIKRLKPDFIINAAAYTDVDGSEDKKELAHKINVMGPKYVAIAANETGAKLIHFSTDFVFEGKNGNYKENNETNPLNYYALTKRDSELVIRENCPNHIIARVCVLYGYNSQNDKNNYVKWVISSLKENKSINVVDDQIICPTLVDDIAFAVYKLIQKDAKGTFHVVGSEAISRYDFAIKIKELFNLPGTINRIKTTDLHQKAVRPLNSSLSIDLITSLGIEMSDTTKGLKILKAQMNDLKAIILSGGQGTRFRPFTYSRQKQLFPIADKDIIFYAIEDVVDTGITNIGIVVGPNQEQVMKELGDGSNWNCALTFIPQDAPKGLAHAVKVSRNFLGDSKFLMVLGDNIFEKGFDSFTSDLNYNAKVMLKKVIHPEYMGIVVVDKGKVTKLVEKPKEFISDLGILGVYFFDKNIHTAIDNITPSWRNELEITDAIEWLVENNYNVGYDIFTGFWEDTGNAEDILCANKAILDKQKHDIKGFIECTYEGNLKVGAGTYIGRGVLIKGPVIIGENCKIERGYIGPYTAIGNNVHIQDCNIENSIVLNNVKINCGEAIRNSILGEASKVLNSELKELLIGDNSVVKL